jgi:hypothetical protein
MWGTKKKSGTVLHLELKLGFKSIHLRFHFRFYFNPAILSHGLFVSQFAKRFCVCNCLLSSESNESIDQTHVSGQRRNYEVLTGLEELDAKNVYLFHGPS